MIRYLTKIKAKSHVFALLAELMSYNFEIT